MHFPNYCCTRVCHIPSLLNLTSVAEALAVLLFDTATRVLLPLLVKSLPRLILGDVLPIGVIVGERGEERRCGREGGGGGRKV